MAITEASRHHMLDRLTDTLGEEAAMTLAEHLPPVGWADVATKADLAHLQDHVDVRFDALDHRFESIDHRFEAIDHRFRSIDQHFDHQTAMFDAKLDAVRGELLAEMRSLVWSGGLANAGLLIAAVGLLLALR